MSKDGYYGDFPSFAEECQAYEEQQRENYEAECGSCPNCGATCHLSELGSNNGIVECINCHTNPNTKQ